MSSFTTGVNSQEPYQGPSRIFLAPTRSRVLGKTLGRLVQWYGLDVYGTAQLTQRPKFDMYGVAAILTVIFLFDLGAWSLLFNMILHAGIMENTKSTFLAVLAGLIFASATLIYERQFMTADTSSATGLKRRLFIWLAIFLRLSVLGAAALVTSQPMELLVFDGAIADRIHEESVWMEALKCAGEWSDAKEKEKPMSQEE